MDIKDFLNYSEARDMTGRGDNQRLFEYTDVRNAWTDSPPTPFESPAQKFATVFDGTGHLHPGAGYVPDDMTIECWVCVDGSAPGFASICGDTIGPNWQDGFTIYYYPGKISFAVQNYQNDVKSEIIGNNAWYHLACTRSATGDAQIFVNGNLEDSKNLGPMTKVNDLRVGRPSNVPGFGLVGMLSNFNVWNRVLSIGEVRHQHDPSSSGAVDPGMGTDLILATCGAPKAD